MKVNLALLLLSTCLRVIALPVLSHCNEDNELNKFFTEEELEILCQDADVSQISLTPKLSIYQNDGHISEQSNQTHAYSYETEKRRANRFEGVEVRFEKFIDNLFSSMNDTSDDIEELIKQGNDLKKEFESMLTSDEYSNFAVEVSEMLKFVKTMLGLILRSLS